MTKKKLLFICLSLIFLSALWYGYHIYNQSPRSIQKEKTYKIFDAKKIIEDFKQSPQVIHQDILEKAIEIKNIQHFTIKNIDSPQCLLVVDDDVIGLSIYFYNNPFKGKKIENTNITIKGIYRGFIPFDTDFGVPGEIKINNAMLL